MEEKMFTDDRAPITKEFLEKNGFHSHYNYYTITGLSKTNGFWNIKIIFAIEHPTYIKRIEIENIDSKDMINIDISTIGGKIYYVHEFQHILKMCGINKKIIL